ncbi:anti-lipopolysaccharide factor [Penaeus vannamei]|uniref:Anti-lipopolysaccharide factor AV-K isoform n=1 Tax=Penaeus vannamei TaxID=6689 RepID=C7DY38_PENVA|nr:anti-lipopolysaccharide factor AV-K isoform [Penaeus vannamei]
MRVSVLTSLVVAVFLVALFAPECQAQGWQAVAAAVASKIVGLWRNEETELLGHKCRFTVKPYIKRLQLNYKGKMWCPGWTTIKGEARTRSHSGVAGRTARDFVEKAFRDGLISEQDAKRWLN